MCFQMGKCPLEVTVVYHHIKMGHKKLIFHFKRYTGYGFIATNMIDGSVLFWLGISYSLFACLGYPVAFDYL